MGRASLAKVVPVGGGEDSAGEGLLDSVAAADEAVGVCAAVTAGACGCLALCAGGKAVRARAAKAADRPRAALEARCPRAYELLGELLGGSQETLGCALYLYDIFTDVQLLLAVHRTGRHPAWTALLASFIAAPVAVCWFGLAFYAWSTLERPIAYYLSLIHISEPTRPY